MRFHIRIDKETPSHTFLTVFANRGNCGELCFSPKEAVEFADLLRKGCKDSEHLFEISDSIRQYTKDNTNDPE